MNTQAIVQLLILLDQITAEVVKLVNSVKSLNTEDEESLRKLIADQREKNNSAYLDVLSKLKARAAE